MEIVFFKSPAVLRTWFTAHHATATELWVGYYKKDSGQASITWPESVDEALSVGWIDGIRKRVDERTYTIRFTPRKNKAASKFFAAQSPWYRRTVSWWVTSAKKEETRLRRVATLIEDSAEGRTIQPMTRQPVK